MADMDAPESVSANKYEPIAELGHGGMADVYLAVLQGMKDFKKLAVLKKLRSHLAEDPEFLAMFLQEARIAARLNHPNVVHTFEVGFDGRAHFMAMEYLAGHPYSAFLARVGRARLAVEIQVKILIDTLEGLHYAHELKDYDGRQLHLVHRDVSPQNVFVTYDGQVKLLDFGIAKALDSAVETRTGIVKGKLAYMSPEQALANPIDRRSDLYAVGVMFWEAIAQRRRWKGLSNVEMMKEIVAANDPVVPPMEGLPPLAGEILNKALAYKADERYQTALEFQADLEKLLEAMNCRVTAREVGHLLADAFKEDRARLQHVIEAEVRKLEARQADTIRPPSNFQLPRLDLPSSSGTPSLPPGSPKTPLPEHTAATVVTDTQTTRKRRNRSFLAYFSVLSLAAAAVVVVIARPWRTTTVSKLPTPPPQQAESAQSTAPSTVHVHLSASPSSAVLYLDGERLGPNPYTADLQKRPGKVEVRAADPGYVPQSQWISLESDVDLELSLVKQPKKPAEAPEKRPVRTVYRRRRRTSPPKVASAPPQPQPKPPAPKPTETSSSVMKPPQKRPQTGVVLDTENPWKN